jgi:HSP20 family molecular chaperone IbpA
MWAQACDLIDRAGQVHRQFFRLAAADSAQALWEPPVDVFEDDFELTVVIALPGVAPAAVEITFESGVLIVRAERGLAFAAAQSTVRRLEIPYGLFESRIALPEGRYALGARECINGCLVLKLHKTGTL